jgi:hypothetical protein
MSFSGGAPPGLAPPPGLGIKPGMATPAQRDELKKFLQWKDPQGAEDKADKLLNMYRVEDVAEAIRDKFGMLPQGWRSLLKSDQIARELPRGQSRTFDIHIHPKDDESMSDKKINEILDSEARFVTTITELQTKYLDRVYEIFGSGPKNKDAIRALGITQEETNQIFEQLPGIVRFSQQLLQKLELVSLVRKQPMTGEGRAIHVGRAFLEMAPRLHVYAPAITSYQQSLTVLNDAVGRLKPNSKNPDFITLWERITSSNDVLRGQQLQAVLITPMQRIPRYKMLLEQLVKDCDHPDSIAVVQEALDLFASAAKNMNEALRKHEKLLEFFGAGSELKPISSTGGTTKDGEVKVVNTYVNKIIGT